MILWKVLETIPSAILNSQITNHMEKQGLYANINRRKKLGISRPKSKSTVSAKAYADMKSGFKKSKKK
jgi:hypothetical protein